MDVIHDDPKRCPIPVAFGEIGKSVYLSGTVRDYEADDVVEGEILAVVVRNGCGETQTSQGYRFRPSRGNYIVEYDLYYPAATGLNSYCAFADDRADVSTRLADLPEIVYGRYPGKDAAGTPVRDGVDPTKVESGTDSGNRRSGGSAVEG